MRTDHDAVHYLLKLAVAADGIVTGFGKASNGVLKNRYPKGLRTHL